MKLITSNNKKVVKMTQKEWEEIGNKTGWTKEAQNASMQNTPVKVLPGQNAPEQQHKDEAERKAIQGLDEGLVQAWQALNITFSGWPHWLHPAEHSQDVRNERLEKDPELSNKIKTAKQIFEMLTPIIKTIPNKR